MPPEAHTERTEILSKAHSVNYYILWNMYLTSPRRFQQTEYLAEYHVVEER